MDSGDALQTWQDNLAMDWGNGRVGRGAEWCDNMLDAHEGRLRHNEEPVEAPGSSTTALCILFYFLRSLYSVRVLRVPLQTLRWPSKRSSRRQKQMAVNGPSRLQSTRTTLWKSGDTVAFETLDFRPTCSSVSGEDQRCDVECVVRSTLAEHAALVRFTNQRKSGRQLV
ncbi:hypothetical protein CC78DRAFT_578197 [Lojkania enalia]|uniref:Uncharacterized protein n=1 Tax=Lojkania enalia TaxID=147567 RepID=A0A9P4KF25_9PLEO|nr:hypothetical protein CC78DRAFT_578197 [Didymosphaeria enalia]